MASKVQTEIYRVIKEIEELNAVERHYQHTLEELREYEEELSKLNKKLAEELKDIEKLEGLSIKSLFHKVLGSKEEQMEKERQEYLQVSLKHQEYIKEIEILEYELSVLEKKVKSVDDLKQELERLKKIREKEILSQPSAMRRQLQEIHNRMDETQQYATEVTEAYRAGEFALRSVKKVIHHMRNAEKWGNWDKMSQGRYHDRMKYGAIDKAINESYQSKRLLTHFSKELRDIGVSLGEVDVNIEGFGGFLDQLFDNLITDWIVQNRIVNALRNIEINHDKVLRIINTLSADIEQQNIILEELEAEKDNLLIA